MRGRGIGINLRMILNTLDKCFDGNTQNYQYVHAINDIESVMHIAETVTYIVTSAITLGNADIATLQNFCQIILVSDEKNSNWLGFVINEDGTIHQQVMRYLVTEGHSYLYGFCKKYPHTTFDITNLLTFSKMSKDNLSKMETLTTCGMFSSFRQEHSGIVDHIIAESDTTDIRIIKMVMKINSLTAENASWTFSDNDLYTFVELSFLADYIKPYLGDKEIAKALEPVFGRIQSIYYS
jgi:hypothetical protein